MKFNTFHFILLVVLISSVVNNVNKPRTVGFDEEVGAHDYGIEYEKKKRQQGGGTYIFTTTNKVSYGKTIGEARGILGSHWVDCDPIRESDIQGWLCANFNNPTMRDYQRYGPKKL